MSAASVRVRWEDLPREVREAVQMRLGGRVVDVVHPEGGFTRGLAARVTYAGGEVFLKASPVAARTASHHRAEAMVGRFLPVAIAPEFLWSLVTAGWIVNAFEAVRGREPDLRPGSTDLTGVLDAVGALERELTPCPVPGAGEVGETLSTLAGHWGRLAAEPPGSVGHGTWTASQRARLEELDDAERLSELSAGDTLVHCDLRADNMLSEFDTGRTRILDWSWGARGAAWVDAAFFVPQLILAGHTPAGAETVLAGRVPGWRAVASEAADAFAVALTGYWTWHHTHGPGGALGAYRGRAAEAGRMWVDYRLA
ncbi:phosphotransferase [Streptomyces sp. NBC_00102]|uniref:phosphotransferase n=1 Tax=Streptomyces sp. NBC_00102 TaxID=2975652 RepID=UPI00224D9025|nr:phosphotransferase [Streptomyces sp. NBC_00102]MCX5401984.1 phosphotransferase [Streptomyces sp. NBC_00102]